MPVVSIVTTTLNRPHFLAEAIQSALAQTFIDFELLVCDDGGSDETRAVCEKFADPRIRHIVNPSRLGIAMNTYAGAMAARADLIAFLNDDDRWTPQFLEKCSQPLREDSAAVLAFSDHWFIASDGARLIAETDQSSRTYGRDQLPPGTVSEPLKLLARNTTPLAMASVFRKSAVEWSRYSGKIHGSYDYFLSYCLLRSGGRVVFIPERLTEYRVHGTNASAEFSLANLSGTSYVNSLVLRDPRFAPIASEIRSRSAGVERKLTWLYFQRMRLLSAGFHFANFIKYSVA